MKHLKRYILLSALLALLICSTIFSVSAAPADTVSIVYGDTSLSFNAEGCTTWQDVVNANDNNMSGGLFIDSKNRVYYHRFDIVEEGPYYVCDAAWDVQYADDPISTSVAYTFNHVTLSFGDFEYEKTLWIASAWFDLADYSELDDGLQINSAGNVIFNHEGLTYYVYTQTGAPVNENDDVTDTHYQLMLDYTFTMEEYSSTGSTGVKHTVSGLVPSLNLYDLVDLSVSFDSDLFAVLGFFNLASDGSIALVDDSTYDSYYLFNDDGLLYELQRTCYYSTDPCSVGVHEYKKQLSQKQPTCTEDGFIRYQCNRCTEVQDQVLPARGHDFRETVIVKEPTCLDAGIQGKKCIRCDYVGYKSSVAALDHDLNPLGNCKRCDYSAVGNALGNAGNAIVDGWNNLFGGSSSGSEEKPWYEDLIDKIKGDGSSSGGSGASGNPLVDGANAIVSVLSMGLLCVGVVILWPILKPIIEFIGDGIKAAFKAVSSGVKSLSKKVKNKKKS